MGRENDRFQFGLTTRGGPLATHELTTTGAATGAPLDWLLWFELFGAEAPLAGIQAADRLSARPIITWEPWRGPSSGISPSVMSQVNAGVHDSHIRRWARRLRDTGTTVYLRFGHEFNGHWYPWSPTGGTSAATFVEVWRRLHRLFSQEEAHTVRWMWSPNAVSESGAPLAQWYPGDDYVDAIGVDGYNWGRSQTWSHWVGPDELFEPALDEIAVLAPGKPILVAEVGCSEAGGSKPDWITALIEFLSQRVEVTGMVWFDHDKETDWRIMSSPTSAAAMAEALRRITSRNHCGTLL
ncbi:glycoside hydrolase family 26 protein [Mycolicibacterium poriferae]|uniref:glycoside hydrolase family 26 protein n=1 Tax=Mycolicibacterium poriferae TaxID=39694 RepID=UPI0024B8B532|nr:glycosyl hydrolase [Mycolicibacterium poriferae]